MLETVSALYWVLPELNAQAGKQEPVPVLEGMLAYADGANWNPGKGKGLYKRDTTWKLLASVDSFPFPLTLSDTGQMNFFKTTITTIAASTTYTQAHPWSGIRPEFATALLICKTAEQGFSVNDETEFLNSTGTGLGSPGLQLDSTNIYYAFDGFIVAMNRSTKARVVLTFANWSLILRAWK